jgi:hypothetical protein
MATQTDSGLGPEDPGAPSTAQAKAQQAAGQAQEKAQAAAGQAQAKVREQLDQRSSQLGEQVHQQASDLRSVSEALRDQGKDRHAQAVDRVAGYAEQAGSYLRDTDADSMLRDAEDFGRRKPAAVAAGGLALGLVASRFLKASSSRRYSARQTEDTRLGTTGSEIRSGAAGSEIRSGAAGSESRPGSTGSEMPVATEALPVTSGQPYAPRSES